MKARLGAACGQLECNCGRQVPLKRPVDTVKERQHWRIAQRFEAWARRALAAEGVQFREWLVLEALSELQDPSKDGLYQVEVARHIGTSERVVAYWMAILDEKAWVDRGPGEDPRHWAVLLTELGEDAVDRCRQRLADAQTQRVELPR
jgi:DNA-binding MarR family transcriptional regulator